MPRGKSSMNDFTSPGFLPTRKNEGLLTAVPIHRDATSPP